jgi:CIC family chloride channel protein
MAESADAAAAARSESVAASRTAAEIDEIAPSRNDRLFLVLSIFVGVLSGLLVVCFRICIEWLTDVLLGSVPHPGQYRLLFAPAAVGLIIGLLVKYVFPGAKGSGVNQTKAALYIYNGYISARTIVGKFVTAAMAIGSGQSLGPEDPSLQIGAGIASLVGRRLHMSRERLRLFAPAGAAAGLAVAFNAPVSAILFVLEEIIGSWSAAVLGSVVLAAVSAVAVARAFWGPQPMFHIPAIALHDERELLAYAVLGVVGGFASVLFSRLLGFLRPWLKARPAWSRPLQPAVGGLLVGAIGFYGFPQVMGAGYQVIDHAMHGEYVWHVLLVLALLKIIATSISFSSGTPGGMFAPTLFIGAMLGASVASVEKIFFPHVIGSVGAYAVVGMGVLFAGFIRVPITSVFMAFELSGNYSIALPVIIANVIAYLIARSLQPTPIFEELTRQDGLVLPSMEEIREETALRIEDALRPWDGQTFLGSDAPALLAARLRDEKEEVALIRCAGSRWYVLTAADLGKISSAAAPGQAIEELLPEDRVPMLYPDMPLNETLADFYRWPLLPIVNRAVSGLLEGTVTRAGVLQTYQRHAHAEKGIQKQ